MIRKYHNHTLQTKPQHLRKSNRTPKVTRHLWRCMSSTRILLGQETRQTAALRIMYIGQVELYLLFNSACTTTDLKLYTFCLCILCAIVFAASYPNYAQWMRRYHLNPLYINETHPAACAMLETWAMSIRRTHKLFFRNLWIGI